jgi:hypothetical protein
MGVFPRVVDADLDGRKDLIVGEAEGTIRLYLNINTDDDPMFDGGTLLEVGEPGLKAAIDVGQRPTPVVTDWDNDGRRDLLVGEKDGKLHFYPNTGSNSAWNFLEVEMIQEDIADLIVPSLRSSPHVQDLDLDGKKDLLLGNTEGQVLFYSNQGSDAEPVFSGYVLVEAAGTPIDLAGTPRSRPFVCDWNNDGINDLLAGSGDGYIRLYIGSDDLTDAGDGGHPSAPDAISLYQNVPNPFNPATMIRFDLPRGAHVKLQVFNVKGELIAILVDRQMSEGRKEITWNGTSDSGWSVASDIYFYRLVAGDYEQTKKMVLLR